MEKEGEPGSTRFGNFINYYSFNPPARRLKLIPSTFVDEYHIRGSADKPVVALDIGSNAGDFTMALYEHLTAKDEEKKDVPLDVHILGIDIDPVLIERSVESNLYTSNICFKVADILSEDDCCNVIVKYLDQHCVRRFNIVFALSITMWIHLNNGDDGLRRFLRYLSSISQFLLVEPQPWHCYQSAARRMKKLGCAPFEHLPSLQWRSTIEQEIVKYLESDECNMKFVRSFGQTESWDRSLYLFKSSHSD